MDLVGRTLLGKYTVERLLGQGGMGTVWLGTHLGTGRKVAIKVLDQRFLSSVSVVQRFGREARAASAVLHEGIVEVLDLDQTEEGVPFLVMEFLEGESLAARIERKGKLAEDEIARVAQLLLSALHAAHERGVVHRDLKPDNIFLVPAGRRGEMVKILDFGISSKDDEQTSKLTQTGSVLGTPHYMSPEQAMGDITVDRRVDIYATGVLLYECAVGNVPFDAPNYNKLLRVILDEEPRSPIERGALIGRELEAVILKALAKDRKDRPPTAAAFAEAIAACVKGRAAPSSSGGRRLSVAPPRPASQPPPAPSAPAASASPSRPPPASDAAASWENASLELAAPQPRRTPKETAPKPPGAPVPGFDDFGPQAAERSPLAFDEEALAGARRSGTIKRPPTPDEPVGEAATVTKSTPAPRGSHPPGTGLAATPGSAGASIAGGRRSLTDLPRQDAPGPAPAAERPWWLPYLIRVGIALGIFLAVVAGLRWLVQPGAEATAAPPPVVVVLADTGPESAPDWVQVGLTGLPAGADVRLDGLPGVALPMRLRRGTHHRVVVRAAGYGDRVIEIDAAETTTIHADMQPL